MTATNETALPVPSDAEVEDVCRRLDDLAYEYVDRELPKAAALIRNLHARAVEAEAECADKSRDADRAQEELRQIASLIGNQFIDPPDGGDLATLDLVRRFDAGFDALLIERDEAVTELAATRDLLREAGEALEPFADGAERVWFVGDGDLAYTRAGHLRRARDVLTKIKEADHGR